MLFSELGLSELILKAVTEEGYETATPIQAGAIPPAVAGRDVLGSAQTGTGKTAAFALPILHRLSSVPFVPGPRKARCLVLCPTRELATQIRDGFRAYGRHVKTHIAVIFGGVGQNPQVADLRRGVDVIVATPGRLMDLMNQGHVDLSGVQTFVLDEADRMLDMGFLPDIKRISQQLPRERQTLMFSATMPPEIRQLTTTILKDPVTINVAPTTLNDPKIEQCVYHVLRENKPALLAHLYAEGGMFRTIVFTRTKHGADRLVKRLRARDIHAEAIHGDKTQNARQRALQNFKASKTPMLVATDVAARGIDVDNVTHVVNYDITHEPETHLHRIGRTGRAGATGQAIAFCDPEEKSWLRAIEQLQKKAIPVRTDLPVFEKPPVGESYRADEDRDRDRRPAPAPVAAPAGPRPHRSKPYAAKLQFDGPVQERPFRPAPNPNNAPRQQPAMGGVPNGPAFRPNNDGFRAAQPRPNKFNGGSAGPGGGNPGKFAANNRGPASRGTHPIGRGIVARAPHARPNHAHGAAGGKPAARRASPAR